MAKTNRSTLHTVYNIQQSVTQDSNDTTQRSVTHDFLRYINILTYLLTYLLTYTDCHAGQQQQPGLAQRVKAARNRRRQGFANIRSGGLLPRKHSPDGATWAHIRLNRPATHLSTPEGWKAELAF